MPPVVPNYGRPAGSYSPVSIDHLHPDHNVEKEVILLVIRSTTGIRKDDHWMLIWVVGQEAHPYSRTLLPVHRRIHIVQEVGYNHLTNWGPATQTSGQKSRVGAQYSLGNMTLGQRKALELIARTTEVLVPNGYWNCQDWIINVLRRAEHEGVVTNSQWTLPVRQAQGQI